MLAGVANQVELNSAKNQLSEKPRTMWKTLCNGHRVSVGDKIRFTNKALSDHLKVYKVEQTEQHYFVVSPDTTTLTPARIPDRKVIRHYDVEHYIGLELWIETS